jgi:protoheme IX farnesyltransferase
MSTSTTTASSDARRRVDSTSIARLGDSISLAWVGVSVRAQLRICLELTKARLSSMVLLSAIVGYWLASTSMDLPSLAWFSLGTFLVVGGANAFNQVLERDADARMNRTARRPIPSGRLSAASATLAAALMSAGGLAILWYWAGTMTALLGLAALGTYVLVYTPLKTITSLATVPGAVSGAIPPLMGASAASGQLGPLAWCLFGILFCWQFPHTWAIAATYRSDYEKAGYHALCSKLESSRSIRAKTVVASGILLGVSFLPTALGLVGGIYLVGAAALGVLVLVLSTRFDGTERKPAVALMVSTLFYLPVVLGLLAIDGRML